MAVIGLCFMKTDWVHEALSELIKPYTVLYSFS